MKNYIFKLTAYILVAATFAACQKVIDIDLNSTDPKIVVQANISDQSFCKVKLEQTINFDETNSFPKVTGAVITITDEIGNTELLTETSQGIYEGTTLQGVAGRTYTLDITTGGKTYTAVSVMPQPVEIDTLINQNNGGPFVSGKSINVKYHDPVGSETFYRFIQTVNNVEQDDIIIDTDLLADGEEVTTLIRPDNEDGYQTGDTVNLFLLVIDKNVYDYFRTFQELGDGGGFGSTSPSNPLTNINNGALGYFSAHALSTKSIVVN